MINMDNFLGRNDDKMQCRGILHIVKAGETLYKIGKMHGVPISRIMYANPYVDIYNLQIGDEICVPVMTPRTQTGGAGNAAGSFPAPMNQGFPAPAPMPMNQDDPVPAPMPMNQGFPTPAPMPMNQGFPAPAPVPINQGYPGNFPAPMDEDTPDDWTTPVQNRNTSRNGTAPMPGWTMGNEAAPAPGGIMGNRTMPMPDGTMGNRMMPMPDEIAGNGAMPDGTMGNRMMPMPDGIAGNGTMPDGTMGNEAAPVPDGTMGNEAARMPDGTMGNEAMPMYGASMGRSAMRMHTVQEEVQKQEGVAAGVGSMREAVSEGCCMGSQDSMPDAAYAGSTEDMGEGRMEQPAGGCVETEECGAGNGGEVSCQAYAHRYPSKVMPWENTAVTDAMMQEYLNVPR